jgi:hypothetical protein
MAVEMNEGFVDLEVRGSGKHIALELLRDVAAVHAGGGAPIADLGPSFLGVRAGWPEHDNGPRHAQWHNDPDNDHRPNDPDHRPHQWPNNPDNNHRPNDLRPGHVAVDYRHGYSETADGGQSGGIGYRGGQPQVLSAGVKAPANDYHSMSAQPSAAAQYSAAAVPSGFSGLATNGPAGLTPSFSTLSEPVNTATGPANAAAVATTGSTVPSQPVTTTPMSSAVRAPATSQPLTTTVAHSSTMGTGIAPQADIGASSSSPTNFAPAGSTSPRSVSGGQPVQHNAGSSTAAGSSWTGASSPAPAHPAAMGSTVPGTSSSQAPTPDIGGSTTKGPDLRHGGDVSALHSAGPGNTTSAPAPAAAPNTAHNTGGQTVTGHVPPQSLGTSGTTTGAPATAAAGHPASATAPSAGTGAATSTPTAVATAPAAPAPGATAEFAANPHPMSASTDSAGSSLTPHPATTSVGTVAPTDSVHPGLSSTSDGLASGLTPSTTVPDSGIQRPTTDHVALTHH